MSENTQVIPSGSNYPDNKITTNGITMWDESGMMLRLSYLAETFSILIAEPFKTESGKNSYPEKNRHSLLLTADRAAALFEGIIKEKILPAYANGENCSKGIFINRSKTSILDIRVQDGEFYLIYYVDIDENRKAEKNYAFHFQKTSVIENYNHQEGTFSNQESIDGWFYIFCKYLEFGIGELCKPSGHSCRRANSYTTSSIFNHLKAITQKLGVIVEPSYRRTSGFANMPSGSSDVNDPLPFNTPTNVEEVESTDMADMLS